jgi:hypothetical protein
MTEDMYQNIKKLLEKAELIYYHEYAPPTFTQQKLDFSLSNQLCLR